MTYEEACNTIPNGYYRHFKGGVYEVIYIAEHTETGEAMVVYQDTYNKIWARPADMWYERTGQRRFEKIPCKKESEENNETQ